MDNTVSEIRRPLAIVTVFAAFMLAVLMSASQPAAAGTGPLTVYGYVYDTGGQPIEGADILVEVLAGTSPSEATTTDEFGYYQVEFDLSEWQIDDTVRTTATYDTLQDYEEGIADASTVLQIDVHFTYAIPEFGSFFGVVVAMVLVGSVAVISMRRGRAQ